MKITSILRATLAVAIAGVIVYAIPGAAAEPKVMKKLPHGVELVKFETKMATHEFMKSYMDGADKDKPVVVFDITLKNTTDKPARYQVSIVMPKEGKSTGGIMPRSETKTAEPGKDVSETYGSPLHNLPDEVTVLVTAVK